MNTIKIKDVNIGEGIPKICVSLIGKSREEIIKEAILADSGVCDLIEWRADYYIFGNNLEEACTLADTSGVRRKLEEILSAIKEVTDKPVILTLRTLGEGGHIDIYKREYYALIRDMAGDMRTLPDIIDIEAFDGDEGFDEEKVRFLTEAMKEAGVAVLLSHHNMRETARGEEIKRRLGIMETIGADISKIAMTAVRKIDLYELLNAAKEFGEESAERPYIAISMGEEGSESRVCGESIGSAVTFGYMNRASAPGQFEAGVLSEYLKMYHDKYTGNLKEEDIGDIE